MGFEVAPRESHGASINLCDGEEKGSFNLFKKNIAHTHTQANPKQTNRGWGQNEDSQSRGLSSTKGGLGPQVP